MAQNGDSYPPNNNQPVRRRKQSVRRRPCSIDGGYPFCNKHGSGKPPVCSGKWSSKGPFSTSMLVPGVYPFCHKHDLLSNGTGPTSQTPTSKPSFSNRRFTAKAWSLSTIWSTFRYICAVGGNVYEPNPRFEGYGHRYSVEGHRSSVGGHVRFRIDVAHRSSVFGVPFHKGDRLPSLASLGQTDRHSFAIPFRPTVQWILLVHGPVHTTM